MLIILLFIVAAVLYFKFGGDVLYKYMETTTSKFGLAFKNFFRWED